MTQAGTRILGAMAAAAVTGLTAAVAYWSGAEVLMKIAGFGTPIAVAVGFWIAPRAVWQGRAITSGLIAMVVATAGGAVVMTAILVGYALENRSAAVFVYYPVILIYVVVSGLLVGVPIALTVVGLLRWAGRRPRLGTALVSTLLGVAVVLGVAGFALDPALLARRGADLRRADEPPVTRLLGRTSLSWSVVNCSPWRYATTVTDRTVLGAIRTRRIEAPGLRTTAAVDVVEPGWVLMIEVDDQAAVLEPAAYGPHPIIEDVPGDAVEVRIEIGVRGGFSSELVVDGATMAHAVPLCPGPAMTR
jgi:hypothetical protein